MINVSVFQKTMKDYENWDKTMDRCCQCDGFPFGYGHYQPSYKKHILDMISSNFGLKSITNRSIRTEKNSWYIFHW